MVRQFMSLRVLELLPQNSNWSAATVEYVVIGGGGGGGGNAGAGGGAGAYRTNTTPIGAHPVFNNNSSWCWWSWSSTKQWTPNWR